MYTVENPRQNTSHLQEALILMCPCTLRRMMWICLLLDRVTSELCYAECIMCSVTHREEPATEQKYCKNTFLPARKYSWISDLNRKMHKYFSQQKKKEPELNIWKEFPCMLYWQNHFSTKNKDCQSVILGITALSRKVHESQRGTQIMNATYP